MTESIAENRSTASIRMLRDVWRWRYLLYTLAAGAVKNEKRNNVLGNLWHLLNPLTQMLIFMFVYQYLFQKSQPHYPLFFLSGMLIFRFVTHTASDAAGIFYRDAPLLKVCSFPRLLVVFACVLKHFFYFTIEGLMVFLLILFYRIDVGWQTAAFLPFVAVLLLGTSGIAVLAATIGAVLPDFEQLTAHLNRILFYFTPVMYPLSLVKGRLQDIYRLNPLASLVHEGRSLLLGEPLSVPHLAYGTVFCGAAFLLGFILFSRLERQICKLI